MELVLVLGKIEWPHKEGIKLREMLDGNLRTLKRKEQQTDWGKRIRIRSATEASMNRHLSLSLDSTQPETENAAPARVKRAQERPSSCSSRRQKRLLILRENKGNTPTLFPVPFYPNPLATLRGWWQQQQGPQVPETMREEKLHHQQEDLWCQEHEPIPWCFVSLTYGCPLMWTVTGSAQDSKASKAPDFWPEDWKGEAQRDGWEGESH